jgi:hypothetical protein
MAAKKKTTASTPKAKLHAPEPELRLDLGCGQTPKEGFEGVDRFAPEAAHKVHLWDGQAWPWPESAVSELHASHLIEHIDAGYLEDGIDALMWFFSEAWRVAKPGATFKLVWPALQSVRAFQDPTHRRFIPMQTLMYLDRNWREMNKLQHYLGSGACDWVMETCTPTCSVENSRRADVVQQRMFVECWGFSEDFVATLRARKA